MFAYDVEIGGICYDLTAKTLTAEVVVNPEDYYGDVVIPETVYYNGETYNVTSIGDCAFRASKIESVVIPNSIKSIGYEAFEKCYDLSYVKFGTGVTEIGNLAFYSCIELEVVDISDLSSWCKIDFNNTNNPLSEAQHLYLNGEEIKDLTIPNDVSHIGNYSFDSCLGLTSLTIPNSVVDIGDGAFGSCSGLTSINLSNGLEKIGYGAFAYCGITKLDIPNSVTSIGNSVFIGCDKLIDITLPKDLTIIGVYSFTGCTDLQSCTIPDRVVTIDRNAFEGCSSLTSIVIPASVKDVNYHSFYGCTNITSIEIGEGVQFIGEEAFAKCKELMDVYCYPRVVPNTQNDAFADSHIEYATLHTPNGTSVDYRQMLPWKDFGTIVEMEGTRISLHEVPFCSWNGWGADAQNTGVADCAWVVGESTENPYGDPSVINYADLSLYSKLIVTVAEGMPRFFFNRDVDEGQWSENEEESHLIDNMRNGWSSRYFAVDGNTYTVDLKMMVKEKGFAHLHAIKGANWANVTVVSMEVEYNTSPQTMYNLNISSSGSGFASFNNTTVRNATKTFVVNEGTSATITFTPDNGYKIKSVKKNGSSVNVTNNQYTVSNIQSNTTVEVEFEAIPVTTYDLTISATGSGYASYSGSSIRNSSRSFYANAESSPVITITPDNGYRIKTLKKNGSTVLSNHSSSYQYTVSNISANTTVAVEFEEIPVTTYTLSIKATGYGSASYNNTAVRNTTKSFTVNAGTSTAITFSPDNGYRIKSVKKNSTDVTSNVSSNKYTVSNIQSNTTIEVEFEAVPITTYNLTISTIGGGYALYNAYSVRYNTRTFTVNAGASPVITISPDDGFWIKALKKDGSTILTNYSGSYQYTVSNISANTTVAVEFEAIPTTSYTLTILAKGNGYVSYYGSNIRNESRSFNVNAGAAFTISFAPDNGYYVMSAVANNADITSSVYDNKYTINNADKDFTIEVTFSGSSEGDCSVLLEELKEKIEQLWQRIDFVIENNGKEYYPDISNSLNLPIEEIISAIVATQPNLEYYQNIIDQDGCSSDIKAQLLSHSNNVDGFFARIDKLEEDAAKRNKELYDTMVNAISSLRSELVDVKASIVDNKYVKAFFEDDIKTIQKDIDALDELVRTDKKLWYQGTFQPKEASIRTALDKLSTNSQKPSLVIGAKGNGYVLINNKYIRNDTILIHDEGAQMFAQYVPDYGNRVKYVKLNYVVITPNNPGQYYIEDIKPGTTFEVEFEEELTSFAYNGMSYKVSSSEDRTIVLSIAGTGKVVEVPAKINYQGTEWKVTGVEKEAFAGNDELAAIIWQPDASFNATVNNPNLLLYVRNISIAPASVKNVVVNGMATNISLMDASSGNEFYCPQEFVAQSIQYSHRYSMKTGMGEAKGWETIVLPFDVDRVTHESKGRIWPFAKWRDGYGARPFWLMQLNSDGWKEAESIKANTPYIISMPNHESYLDDYLLNGIVTFSAENATVRKSDAMQTASYKDRTFVPTYAEVGMSEDAYALNVSNDIETNVSGMADGSRFVLNLRKVHPFEAYMTTTRATRSIDISEGMGIIVNNGDEERISVYNMKGMMMKTKTGDSMEEIRRSLPAGVYIINKRKVLVK